ncbi:MAG: hypothetical protein ACOY3Y_13635 [Acidobacteriota bacterium]
MNRSTTRTQRTRHAAQLLLAAVLSALAVAAAAAPAVPPTPTLTVHYFKEMAESSGMARIGSAPPPTSSTIELGEDIRLGWSATGCHMSQMTVSISGIGTVTPSNTREREGNCREIWGRETVRPTRTTTYQLTVAGTPVAGAVMAPQPVRRSYEVVVRAPDLDLLTPEVDQGSLRVSLSLRNRGEGRFLNNRITVNYTVARAPGHHTPAGSPFHSGSFTAGPLQLAPGAQASLGSFTLPDRAAAFAQETIQIAVTLTFPGYPATLDSERENFNHRWDTRTSRIGSMIVEAFSTLSELRIRLNGFRAGEAWPAARNDSLVSLTINGAGSPLQFDTPGQRYNVRIKLRNTDLELFDRTYGVFVNQITAESIRRDDLFAIQDGKLKVHLEFPNGGNGEIKIGEMQGSRWVDGEAPDIDISRFEINVFLTPTVRDNKISYSTVRVEVPSVSARLEGRFEVLNPFIEDHLRRYVRDAIVSQLTAVLGRSDVKRAVEDGLTSALSLTGATRILSVTGSGNEITIVYL